MTKKIIFSFAILAFAISCVPECIDPVFEPGSYFPHTAGSRWKYEIATNCNEPMQGEMCISTAWAAAGPEIFGDDSNFVFDSLYYPMTSPITSMQFIKVVGSEYFLSGWYMQEAKFLDDNLELNKTWTIDLGFRKKIYTVTEVNVTKTVRGVRYRNVIVVTEVYQFEPASEGKLENVHYYAQGVGEVYSKSVQEYNGRVQIRECSLIEYNIAPKE